MGDTSGKLLEDKAISDAVATYAVDQLYANVDVTAVIKQRLPPDLQPFSAPAAAGIRQFATQAAQQAIQSPRVQQAGGTRTGSPTRQLVSILKGNNEVVSSQNGKVVLNLRPLVLQLADRIGLKKQLNQKAAARTSGSSRSPTRRISTPRGRSRSSSRGSPGSSPSAALALFGARGLPGEGAAAGWSCSATASA